MKEMKKLKFLFVMLLGLMSTSARAQNMQYLVLDLTDGTQTVIPLADQPVITCQDGELKVAVAGEVKVQSSLDGLLKYSFSETEAPSGIEQLLNEESHLEAGHVYVANAKAGDTVRIFTADGRQVAVQPIGSDGTANIDLTTLGKGLLIVKLPKTSIKVINK